MKRRLLVVLLLLLSAAPVFAQFKREAFQQSYNDDKATSKDSVDVLFSLKEYFGGLKHENELKIGTMFAGSVVFIGGEQIYNKQYWKLPIVYTTIFGSLGTGIYLNTQGKHDAAKYCFIGAGVAYWGTLMDGVISYKSERYPLPGRATLYSLLVPGLGQRTTANTGKSPSIWAGLPRHITSTITTTSTISGTGGSIRKRRVPRSHMKAPLPRTRHCTTGTSSAGTGITPSWQWRWSISSRS